MPTTRLKNTIYRMALAISPLPDYPAATAKDNPMLRKIFLRHHVTGGTLQVIENGQLSDCFSLGIINPSGTLATHDTVYRTASITKFICAMAAIKVSEGGAFQPEDDIGKLLGITIPRKIPVSTLLSHTSSLVDSPAYFQALSNHTPLNQLLTAPVFTSNMPGDCFLYSNFAAGIVGSVLEKVTGKALPQIVEETVFTPANAKAGFSLSSFQEETVSSIRRVLPLKWTWLAEEKRKTETVISSPDPMLHYAYASGNMFSSAPMLGKIAIMLMNNAPLFKKMCSVHVPYGKADPHFFHGLGILQVEDKSLCSRTLYGHQGFAYGAVNGVFFDAVTKNGFVLLTSGASEARYGRMALLNRDLIQYFFAAGGRFSCMK